MYRKACKLFISIAILFIVSNTDCEEESTSWTLQKSRWHYRDVASLETTFLFVRT